MNSVQIYNVCDGILNRIMRSNGKICLWPVESFLLNCMEFRANVIFALQIVNSRMQMTLFWLKNETHNLLFILIQFVYYISFISFRFVFFFHLLRGKIILFIFVGGKILIEYLP